MKARIDRNDAPDTSLWQQSFSNRPPEPGVPRLRWPGDPADQDVKTMTDGLKFYASGVQMTFRNSAAHGTGELTVHAAIERLAALSLLARWLDECEVDRVD